MDLSGYALKSELEEVKTKIDNASKAHQDLAILVGNHVASIVTINSKISNLERENVTLKDTIAAMEARIYATEPHRSTLPDFYQGFNNHEVGENDYWEVSNRGGVMYFDICFEMHNDDSEYVFVLNDNKDVKHYIRLKINFESEECVSYLDELNGNTEPLTQNSSGYYKIPDDLQDSFGSYYKRTAYLEVYSKP